MIYIPAMDLYKPAKSVPENGFNHGQDNLILIAVLLAAIASLLFNWFGTGYALERIMEEQSEERALRWGHLLESDLQDLDTLLAKGKPSQEDLRTIQTIVSAGSIFRFKFFNAHGVIVYASREEDAGHTIRKSYFYEIVKEGVPFIKVEKEEDFGSNIKYVVEAYIPILKNGIFRGAIEVYLDLSQSAATMQRYRIIAFFVLFGFTLLLCGMFAITTIRSKVRQEIADQNVIAKNALEAVNEVLESRVTQRTQELELEIKSHLETEAELVDAMMKAERANTAKSAFLSSVSHELRTPMNAIMGFAQVLQLSTQKKLDRNEVENLQDIITNGDKLIGLIDQILKLSKLETGNSITKSSQFKIDELIKECEEEYLLEAKKREITITSNVSTCLDKTVTVDRNCLKQALLNLLSNAIKYNKPGGVVSINCECNADVICKITVTDTGLGIPINQHDAIFHSFERLGREGHNIDGTGIGLSIAKSLIELIDGRIGFESDVGHIVIDGNRGD